MSDERFPGVVEDDPEYDGDAAADVDAEDFGFAEADPTEDVLALDGSQDLPTDEVTHSNGLWKAHGGRLREAHSRGRGHAPGLDVCVLAAPPGLAPPIRSLSAAR